MAFDVIAIGSATIDVFARMKKRFSQVKPGDKVLVDFLDIETGGGGTNSAVALARMGLKTAFLGKLGKDHNADEIRNDLKKERVYVIPAKPFAGKTAFSVVLGSRKEKDRIIYVYKGASNELAYSDFNADAINTKWIYMATMMNKSFRTVEKIAKIAKQRGTNILFNPSLYLAAKGKKYLKNILDATTVIVLNKKEAAALLRKKKASMRELLHGLAAIGPRICVVTEGSKGVNAFDGGCYYHMKPYKTKIVNTAGAGDAFTSGLLAGMIKTESLDIAIKTGMANASSVMQQYGTKNGLLSWKQAQELVKKHKKELLRSVC